MNGDKIKNSLVVIVILFIIFLVYGFFNPKNINFSSAKNEIFEKRSSAEIVIVGDIMLDRNVRNIIKETGFDEFFKGVKDLISGADLSIGNLEGPFTTYPSVTTNLKNKELKFTFDPAHAPALAQLGFDILGLANNHTLNFGREGLEMTRRYIGSSGMIYYGDPLNKDEISTIVTKNNIAIGLIGFHEFSYINYDKVLNEIVRLRPLVDVLIVTPHWGEEYQKEPTIKMEEWAHKFIDLGGDAVIGSHPHVVGNKEIYKDKQIYYSLGNFAFDQYFSEETMKGLSLVMNVQKVGKEIEINYLEVPIRVDKKGIDIEP
jgi:gamma-polyglutamate biosynthesis protein CapA